MAETTKIQWCHHTFNPWRGCTKVSAGCTHCYAETLSKRNPAVLGEWGPQGQRVVAAESYWREPLKWDRAAQAAGERRRVFCASLADVFEGPETMPAESVPVVEAARARLFRLIALTPYLDWLLLTKRPQNVLKMTFDVWCHKVPGFVTQNQGDGRRWDWPPNVWLGVSIEDQRRAGERIPHLLRTPAAVRFVSAEPLLGPVDLTNLAVDGGDSLDALRGELCALESGCLVGDDGPVIDWVIIGGESGPGARPFNVDWARSLVRQCRAAGAACFVKQLGANVVDECEDCTPEATGWPAVGGPMDWETGRVRLRDPKGGDPDEWSEDLKVREFPEG